MRYPSYPICPLVISRIENGHLQLIYPFKIPIFRSYVNVYQRVKLHFWVPPLNVEKGRSLASEKKNRPTWRWQPPSLHQVK